MTYFEDTELPLIVVKNPEGKWTVGWKWYHGGAMLGEILTLDHEPDETDRELLHKTFMDSYKDWQQE